jgi:hypothetical protein
MATQSPIPQILEVPMLVPEFKGNKGNDNLLMYSTYAQECRL